MQRTSCFIVFFIVLISCVSEEYVDIAASKESRLVVFSMITPGDSIYVYVERTAALNKWIAREDLFVTDAMVTMTDANDNSIQLIKLPGNLPIYGASQETFKITPGQTYYLSVSTLTGAKVSSTSTVPLNKAYWKTLENKGVVDNDGHNNYYGIEGSWQGLEESNYGYHVSVDCYNSQFAEPYNIEPYVLSISQINNLYFFRDDFFVEQSRSFSFILCTTDQNIAQFNQMLIPYILQRDVKPNDLLNSFKGVYQEFTNIDGGYGFFGAYLTDRKLIVIK